MVRSVLFRSRPSSWTTLQTNTCTDRMTQSQIQGKTIRVRKTGLVYDLTQQQLFSKFFWNIFSTLSGKSCCSFSNPTQSSEALAKSSSVLLEACQWVDWGTLMEANRAPLLHTMVSWYLWPPDMSPACSHVATFPPLTTQGRGVLFYWPGSVVLCYSVVLLIITASH